MGKILKQRVKQNKFDSVEDEAYLNVMITAYYLRSKTEAVLKQHGLTSPQFNVLRILKGVYPDGHPRCEIIDRMIEPAPDVTRLIDKLFEERLVERFQSNEDKRHSISRITKKGIELLEKVNPQVKKLSALLGNKLTKNELTELSKMCEKIYGSEP